MSRRFRFELRDELERLVTGSRGSWPRTEILRLDLHCHDANSDVPDERLGRILRAPESWLPTDQLVSTLTKWGMDVLTVTNHNNARSCWALLDKGIDILPGAEFSCTFPDFSVGVHVLAYGFTPSEEVELLRRRANIYSFLEYTAARDLPTVLAHPLHLHSAAGFPPLDLFDRLALMFERFEVLNGQRDTWQNMLVAAWVQTLDQEEIERLGRRTGIDPGAFCRNPWTKRMCGGSDDHCGLFAGTVGTHLHVPDLTTKVLTQSKSSLALQALRSGETAPFGSYTDDAKLALALLDYFCQIAMKLEDPGLIRMMLHAGTAREKTLALFIANAILELRRHRYTLRFLSEFHGALNGKRPGVISTALARGPLRKLIAHVEEIAETRRERPEQMIDVARITVPQLFRDLNTAFVNRASENLSAFLDSHGKSTDTRPGLLGRFELPAHLRELFGAGGGIDKDDITSLDVGELLDGLPFPFLASLVIGGAAFASARSMFGARPLLNRFAEKVGRFEHPRRALWLTDSLFDRNGVSESLQSVLEEIQRRDLPIDLLVHSRQPVPPQPHLIVMEPLGEFTLPFYPDQPFRLPNLLEIHKTFLQGGYDRVISSTELLMGPFAMYLKRAFAVPAYFFVHTDWMGFAEKTLGLDHHQRDRLRRLLRAFYRDFDGLFVLSSEHRQWLEGPEMSIAPEKIHLTSHWVDRVFMPMPVSKYEAFPGLSEDDRVLLFVGRVSDEKGVMQLPGMIESIRREVPRVRLVIAGSGPAEARLKEAVPDALFLGWVDHKRLPSIYSGADIMLFPSQFDTFGCAVLESMACGLPVAAFEMKGPRDIITDGVDGFLFQPGESWTSRLSAYLKDPTAWPSMRARARERADQYQAEPILAGMLEHIGLGGDGHGRRAEADERLHADRLDERPSFLSDLIGVVEEP